MKRAALAVALLAACSPPPPPAKCTPAGFMSQTNDGLAVAGDVLNVAMRLGVTCPSSIQPRVIVTVRDPNNFEAPLFEGEATRDAERVDGEGLQTFVKVRSTLPGAYHFTARFEPNLGLAQKDVFVAENHRDAGATLSIPGGTTLAGCRHIDVTPLGRPVCLTGDVRLYDPDGGTLVSLGAPASAARVDDVLWVSQGSRLSRWVETSAGLVAVPDASYSPSLIGPFIAADPQGLFATLNGDLTLIDVQDGGFVERAHLSMVAQRPSALWKRGDEYVLLGSFNDFETVLCTGRFRDGGTCSSAFSMSGLPVPFPLACERAGVWTWSNDFRFGALSLTLRAGTGFRELTLPPGWGPLDAGVAAWDTGVAIRNVSSGDEMLVLDRQGTFVIQKFPPGRIVSVTSRWVALQSPGGGVLIYPR